MSGIKDLAEQSDLAGAAFEYVAGTLKGVERRDFESRLENSAEHKAAVAFWEEQLLALNSAQTPVPPYSDGWQRLENRLFPSPRMQSAAPGVGWSSFLQWFMPSAAALVLAIVIVGYKTPSGVDEDGSLADTDTAPASTSPNIDYVAVLTDSDGKAILTALTAGEGQRLWLKWEDFTIAPDSSLQLWAKSKRDGEIRPLAVFDDTNGGEIQLSETTFRLITDSSFLLLTQEEQGGSALDEPSDTLLARGFCVRFSRKDQAAI